MRPNRRWAAYTARSRSQSSAVDEAHLELRHASVGRFVIPGEREIEGAPFVLALDRSVGGHRQSYNNINFVRLFFFCNAPATRSLKRDRTANREPHGSTGTDKILTLYELE